MKYILRYWKLKDGQWMKAEDFIVVFTDIKGKLLISIPEGADPDTVTLLKALREGELLNAT